MHILKSEEEGERVKKREKLGSINTQFYNTELILKHGIVHPF